MCSKCVIKMLVKLIDFPFLVWNIVCGIRGKYRLQESLADECEVVDAVGVDRMNRSVKSPCFLPSVRCWIYCNTTLCVQIVLLIVACERAFPALERKTLSKLIDFFFSRDTTGFSCPHPPRLCSNPNNRPSPVTYTQTLSRASALSFS